MSKIETLINDANILFANQLYEQALKTYLTVLDFEPNHSTIHLLIANTYVALGINNMAFSYFEKQTIINNRLLEQIKNNLIEQQIATTQIIDTLYQNGMESLANQQFEQAEQYIEELKHVEHHQALLTAAKLASKLADRYLANDEYLKAKQFYDESLQLDSSNGRTWYGLASLYKAHGLIPEAISCLDNVMQCANADSFDYFLAHSRKLSLLTNDAELFLTEFKKFMANAAWIHETNHSELAAKYFNEVSFYYYILPTEWMSKEINQQFSYLLTLQTQNQISNTSFKKCSTVSTLLKNNKDLHNKQTQVPYKFKTPSTSNV